MNQKLLARTSLSRRPDLANASISRANYVRILLASRSPPVRKHGRSAVLLSRRKPSRNAAQAALCRRKPAGRSGLAGGSGTGKTLLVQTLARQLNESCRAIRAIGFPADVAHRVDVVLGRRRSRPRRRPAAGSDQTIRRIKQFLAENETARTSTRWWLSMKPICWKTCNRWKRCGCC